MDRRWARRRERPTLHFGDVTHDFRPFAFDSAQKTPKKGENGPIVFFLVHAAHRESPDPSRGESTATVRLRALPPAARPPSPWASPFPFVRNMRSTPSSTTGRDLCRFLSRFSSFSLHAPKSTRGWGGKRKHRLQRRVCSPPTVLHLCYRETHVCRASISFYRWLFSQASEFPRYY